MEWHVVHTVAASFFGVLGFFMDYMSLMSGLRARRRKSTNTPVLFWPFLCYLAAAFICDGSMKFKAGLLAAGLVFHILATAGVRPRRRGDQGPGAGDQGPVTRDSSDNS